MTLDESLAKHPGPWTYSPRYDAIFDAKGVHVRGGYDERLVEAVNRIGELQAELDQWRVDYTQMSEESAHKAATISVMKADVVLALSDTKHWQKHCVDLQGQAARIRTERDSLQSKAEELEQMLITQRDIVHDLHEQRRFELTKSAMQGILSQGGFAFEEGMGDGEMPYPELLMVAQLSRQMAEVQLDEYLHPHGWRCERLFAKPVGEVAK